MILACAKRMYGEHYSSMCLELNASDDRGIDVVRDQIKEFAGTKKLFSSGTKLIILDEADAMTQDAQSALRRGMSRNTKVMAFTRHISHDSTLPHDSDRKVYVQYTILHDLQLREQDHSRFTVPMHQVSTFSVLQRFRSSNYMLASCLDFDLRLCDRNKSCHDSTIFARWKSKRALTLITIF
jgi:hypothetical protein